MQGKVSILDRPDELEREARIARYAQMAANRRPIKHIHAIPPVPKRGRGRPRNPRFVPPRPGSRKLHLQRYHLSGRFGCWEVLHEVPTTEGPRFWLCRCDCGVERAVLQSSLRLGRSISCGCIKDELLARRSRTHGRSFTREYRAWLAIRRLCYKTTYRGYQDVGAKGIRVFQRWMNSFETFAKDVGLPPSRKHWLCRIDLARDYEPGNVKWLTRSQLVTMQWQRRRMNQATIAEPRKSA